jgi:hypothetical protein
LEVTQDPERMRQMSQINLEVAHEYQYEVIQQKRNIFYQKVREIVERIK